MKEVVHVEPNDIEPLEFPAPTEAKASNPPLHDPPKLARLRACRFVGRCDEKTILRWPSSQQSQMPSVTVRERFGAV